MIPSSFIAGDTLIFDVDSAYLADGRLVSSADWTLAFKLNGNGATATGSAVARGSGWTVTVLASATAALPAGTYGFAITATKAAERVTLASGSVKVSADLSAVANTFDSRSTAEINLDLVTAAINTRLAGGMVEEYTIGTRSLRYSSIAALLALQSSLQNEVARERAAARVALGLKSGKRIGVRFG